MDRCSGVTLSNSSDGLPIIRPPRILKNDMSGGAIIHAMTEDSHTVWRTNRNASHSVLFLAFTARCPSFTSRFKMISRKTFTYCIEIVYKHYIMVWWWNALAKTLYYVTIKYNTKDQNVRIALIEISRFIPVTAFKSKIVKEVYVLFNDVYKMML